MTLIRRPVLILRARSGVTLIEILIVMAIVVLLAGLTLPSLKNLLKDQRIGQAARVVQGFAESARARSIATGRQVALVLERSRIDGDGGAGSDGLIANDTCIRMSLGEVFPPYEGDWSGTTAAVYDVSNDGYVDWMEIDPAQAASLTGAFPLVSAGDIVELADRQQRFVINEIDFKASVTGSGIMKVRIDLINPPFNYGLQTNEANWPLTPALGSGEECRFRIYRKPAKMMAGSVVLPRGTCIDLSMSGVGPEGREFSTMSITPTGTSPTSGDYGATSLVFGPRGTLESVSYQQRAIVGGNVIASLEQVLPNGIYHLLIGRTDQVDPMYGTPSSFAAVSTRDGYKPNLIDPANVWVSINPYSGMIYSSPVNVGAGDVLSARLMASSGVLRPGK